VKDFIRYSLAALVSLCVAYLVLQGGILRLPYIQVSTLHKLIILGSELFLGLFLFSIYQKKTWGDVKKGTYLLVFLIANCFIAYPFLTFYLDKARLEVPLIRLIRPYLIPGYAALVASVGVIALLSYRDVGRFRAWLVGVVDGQEQRDLQAASEQEAHFRQRYPNLAHLPLALALYREGWKYVLALLALMGLGLVLRLWNLGALPPYSDELLHLNAAKAIVQGLALGQIEYRRSLYTVTLPVAASFRLYGINLWAGRLPGVILNILGVLPLYMLSKRINKPVALLAVGLYVFSPWMIAISRTVREYATYALYFYLIAWIMLKFYEGLPSGLVFLRDYRNYLTPWNLVYAGVLGLVFIYFTWVDPLSTFKVILGMYLAFGLFLLRKLDWRNPGNLLIVLLVAAAGAFQVITFLTLRNRPLVTGTVDSYYLALFYDHPIQQWYYNRPLIAIVLLILALLAADFLRKKKVVLPFTLLIYGIAQLSFAALWVKGFKPRYAISIEFWHILIMAVGLFAAQAVVQKLTHKGTIAWVGLLLLFWNIPHTLLPSLNTTPGYAPITEEHHANLSAAYAYLQSHARSGDVLVSSTYFKNYVGWIGDLRFDKAFAFRYNRTEAKTVVFETIKNYPAGWIVLYTRGDDLWWQPLPPESLTHAEKRVKFVGWYGDQYILHWGE